MGQDLPPGCSDQSRVGISLENLRRRDPNSRELLGPLFGQVAVATVRNVLFNSVASLQNVDKLLAGKVAQLRETREQLQVSKNEDERRTDAHLRDESGTDFSLQPEEHATVDASYILQNDDLKHLKDE